MSSFIGVDLGGTNLRAAIVDTETGRIDSQRRCPTLAAEGQDAVIRRIIDLIRELTNEGRLLPPDIRGVGVGIPGTVDMERGVTELLPNLPGKWPNVPLRAILREEVGMPVALINDVRAMTLAEWTFGAGRGADTVVCLAIGTGIGGGVVVNGQFYLGIGGTAGEFGHHIVEPNGLVCGCGSRGCLELYASGPAIAAMGAKEVVHGHTTRIGELVDYDLNRITAETVVDAARQGDQIANAIMQRAAGYLGIAVSNIIGTISPQRVIFGGGVSRAGDLLLGPIVETIKARLRVVPVARIEFLLAELGSDAGLVGAALWAKRRSETIGTAEVASGGLAL